MTNIFTAINKLFNETPAQEYIPDGHLSDAHAAEVLSTVTKLGADDTIKDIIKKLISSKGKIAIAYSNDSVSITAMAVMADETRGLGGLLDQSTFLIPEIMFKKHENRAILIPRRTFGSQYIYCDRDIEEYNKKSAPKNNIQVIIPVTERGWWEYEFTWQFITKITDETTQFEECVKPKESE